MPLPLILGIGAGVGVKLNDSRVKLKNAHQRHEKNIQRFNTVRDAGDKAMNKLASLELEILRSFNDFSDMIEKIQKRPIFKEYKKDEIKLPEYNAENLKQISHAAEGMVVGALTGVTSAAGTLFTGGGGMILLGTSTFGVGLLVGGVIAGIKISAKADEAWEEMLKAEKTINESVAFLRKYRNAANRYTNSLTTVRDKYNEVFNYLSYVINNNGKTDWNLFSDDEKLATQNLVLLVGLLYKMCQVSLVKKANSFNDDKVVNTEGVSDSIHEARTVLSDIQ